MATAKNLGVWMDRNNAHLMEFTIDRMDTNTASSEFSHDTKDQGLHKSVSIVTNNNIQHYQSDYYEKLEEIIKNYEEVLLFGPAGAKVDFLNNLKDKHFFGKIKIEVKETEKMTENQQYTFVKEYFSNH